MANNKKSFVLYCDLIKTVSKLPNYKAGELFKHLLEYVNDLDPQTDDLLVDIAFEPIKQQLKRDLIKWGETKDVKSTAGKEGNLKRWNSDLYDDYKKGKYTLEESLTIANDRKAIKEVAKIAVNDTVTVTVNDTVIKDTNSTTAKAIDFVKLLTYINTTFGRQFRIINDSIKTKYKARIKEGYTNEDIKTAIDNCRKSKHHIDTNFKYCTPEFFSRSVMLDKYSSTTEGLTTIQPQKFETLEDVKNLWQ
jgi:uncharacterized phage protein (TIGR02220 family)